MRRELALIVSSLVAAGCGPTPAQLRRETVLKRSAREWDCEKEDVKVRYLGGAVYEAKGCGRRATYVCGQNVEVGPGYTLDTSKVRCVLESRDEPAPPPAPAPPRRNETMPGWE